MVSYFSFLFVCFFDIQNRLSNSLIQLLFIKYETPQHLDLLKAQKLEVETFKLCDFLYLYYGMLRFPFDCNNEVNYQQEDIIELA